MSKARRFPDCKHLVKGNVIEVAGKRVCKTCNPIRLATPAPETARHEAEANGGSGPSNHVGEVIQLLRDRRDEHIQQAEHLDAAIEALEKLGESA